MLLVEFTIEPFTEGNPGQHVRAAVAAAEALGVAIDFGPFGSTCHVDESRIADVTSAVVGAAIANGASHVTLHVERAPDAEIPR